MMSHANKKTRISPWLARLLVPALLVAAGLLLIVAIGAAQRIGWLQSSNRRDSAERSASQQIYICPMHPHIRKPYAGTCDICGMPLELSGNVPSGDDASELFVDIPPAQRRLANIQTAKVRREPIAATIQTIGEIAIDESRMATVASYVDGRLERLFADYTGVKVAENDHLAVVYSPKLYADQVEYLDTRKRVANLSPNALPIVRQTQQKLLENSRHNLEELGMTPAQLEQLDATQQPKSRLTIYTPIGGTVIEKLAVEGKYVNAGEPIYHIANLDTVWLMLELYPDDAARIRFGQQVDATVQSLPGETFHGRVAFMDPTVDPNNRTVGVRVEFLNGDGRLRPGDYATATIHVLIGEEGDVYDAELAGRWISPMHPQIIRDAPGQCPICGMDLVPTSRYGYSDEPVDQPASLFVPRSAVLMAGNSSVVYVETAPGRFEIRPVTVGPILRDKVVIVAGLKEGETVATHGNFLIDSQMQLAGKPSLIDPTKAIVAQQQRKVPLEFDKIEVAMIPGETGEQLQSLYNAYFRIQATLAADKKPTEQEVHALHKTASSLVANEQLPDKARKLVEEIAQHSEHLHHMDIGKARHDAFRPISHAIVKLASQVRGETANDPYYHMFCPMVKGGAGDWLQPNDKLVNPYWGSQMLQCGDVVREMGIGSGEGRMENRE